MATKTISDRHEHVRSIGVTAVTALIGVTAAYMSFLVTGEPAGVDPASEAATDPQVYLIVLAAILGQIVLVKASGIYGEDELGPKHYLFIAFMTFAFWFVSLGILLSSVA